jgi:hypothetical protein
MPQENAAEDPRQKRRGENGNLRGHEVALHRKGLSGNEQRHGETDPGEHTGATKLLP